MENNYNDKYTNLAQMDYKNKHTPKKWICKRLVQVHQALILILMFDLILIYFSFQKLKPAVACMSDGAFSHPRLKESFAYGFALFLSYAVIVWV